MNNQHNETPPKNEPREYEAEEEVLTDTGAIDAGTVTDLDQNPPESRPQRTVQKQQANSPMS